MKKIFTTAALGLFLLAGTATSAAQSLSSGTIQLDYQYENVTSANASYQAPSNGVFTIKYDGYQGNNLYQDSTETNLVPGDQVGWVEGADVTYDWTYNLTANQTVYFIFADMLNPAKVMFTFEESGDGDGTGPVVYEIVSMTPAAGNLTKPTDQATMPTFTVTLNEAFKYSSGQPPYWQLYDNTESDIILYSRSFTDNSTTGDNTFNCESVDFEFYGDIFVVGHEIKFQMSLDGGITMLDGYTWTVVAASTTDPDPDPTPGVEAEEIVPGTPFTVTDTKPLWVYTPTTDVPDFYFSVADFGYDVFEDDPTWGPGLIFATDPEGANPVTLTPVLNSKDEYDYTGTNLVAETSYYIILKDQYSDFTMNLILEKLEVATVPQVTEGVPFFVSSSAQEYQYTNGSEGDYYIVSNSDTNLLTNGSLLILYQGGNIFADYMEVETVDGEEGLVYRGLYFQPNETYTIKYSGSETIELTIVKGTYGSKYMSNTADVFDNDFATDDYRSAVTLFWGEAVELVDADDVVIPVYQDNEPLGFLTAEHLQLVGMAGGDDSGVDPLAETGDMGLQLLILTGASELFLEAGTYVIWFPEGVVKNAEGEINVAQNITVTVAAVASPVSISPETGAIFALGENVEFAIVFDGDIVADPEAERVVFVYNDNDYESEDYFEASYTWADTSVIAVDAAEMVITLGEELPEGNYVLSVDENVLTVDEAPNASIEIMFQVTDESEGVNTIGSALEGNEAIYNLQGVRVDANKLSKGIYIINGKKVLVK